MENDRSCIPNTLSSLFLFIAGFFLGLVAVWICRALREKGARATELATARFGRLTLEPRLDLPAPTPTARPEPDDLTRIAGIGPKMSSLLQEAGMVTFEQLAASDVGDLNQLLREEGLQFADPGTWPEQAALAAAGAWDALDDLQDELSGGRRVA